MVSQLPCSQNPSLGWSHNCLLRKTPVRGGLTIACFEKPLVRGGLTIGEPETGTGDRDRPVTGFWYFLKIRIVTMSDSDPDEEWSAEESCQEEQNSEGGDDVQEVEASGSRASVKPILRLSERNDEDTAWTRVD